MLKRKKGGLNNFFIARRYSSAVYAMALCLSFCLSLCLSVCQSQVGVVLKWLNVGTH